MPLEGLKLIGKSFDLQGYPDSAKVIRLSGPKACRLADLELHRQDLLFCLSSLEAIDQVPVEAGHIRQALWRSAVVHFLKCFGGHDGRFSLQFGQVFHGAPEAKESFDYFDSLRNKHVVHDENSYSSAAAGAVLNKAGVAPKIADVFAISFIADTLSPQNQQSLRALAQNCHAWVVEQVKALAAVLTRELETEEHAALLSREEISYTVPDVAAVHVAKPAV